MSLGRGSVYRAWPSAIDDLPTFEIQGGFSPVSDSLYDTAPKEVIMRHAGKPFRSAPRDGARSASPILESPDKSDECSGDLPGLLGPTESFAYQR